MKTDEKKTRDRAETYLREMLGDPRATFRNGQWEAIRALVVDRSRALVVQRTGWGKSMVYLLATRLLRDRGAGPTILVSPLLALMRNQIEVAGKGSGPLRMARVDSSNRESWEMIESNLRRDAIDLLLISPERFQNERFRERALPHLVKSPGLFVIDEAHCISDWGHDFRPDYQRLRAVLRYMPPKTPILATTATANRRVVDDIVDQLGEDLRVLRGPLVRKALRLQAIELPSQAERLAWLAQQLPEFRGSGIVYVRTVRDAKRVAAWLRSNEVDAREYHGGVKDLTRQELEGKLARNEIDVLVATSALGMGYDKPDLRFVVHFQRPGSVVEYYQQVGRAGRDGEPAYGILLSGREDDRITDSFIRSAFPDEEEVEEVLGVLRNVEALTLAQLEERVNTSRNRLQHLLKVLTAVDRPPILREYEGGVVYRLGSFPYDPDPERQERLKEVRREEQTELREYMRGKHCHMAFLREALDDEDIETCGICAVCRGPLLSTDTPPALVHRAQRFVKHSEEPMAPRKKWPSGKWIDSREQLEEGRSLCVYRGSGWGKWVERGKYEAEYFADALVEAAAEMIVTRWRPEPFPEILAWVPSLKHPDLVRSFARRLGLQLDILAKEMIYQEREKQPQKAQENSHHQVRNLEGVYRVDFPEDLENRSFLLVDDIVDSKWTLTCLGVMLKRKGAGKVYPFALATAR